MKNFKTLLVFLCVSILFFFGLVLNKIKNDSLSIVKPVLENKKEYSPVYLPQEGISISTYPESSDVDYYREVKEHKALSKKEKPFTPSFKKKKKETQEDEEIFPTVKPEGNN